MKSFTTLLKVAQRKLDELAIESARIGAEIDELHTRIAAIQARERAEIASATLDPTFAAMLPAYRQRVKMQVEEVRAQATAKEKALEEIRQQLSAAYIEKSKFEQLIEQAERRAAADRAAREQAHLDEVALNRASAK